MSSYFEKKEKQAQREDKPSWRDIDARKDGKNAYSSDTTGRSKKQSVQEKQKQTQAKKDLKELFKPKKNPAQMMAWQELEQSKGRVFQSLALQYIHTHGMPRVWDDLLTLLQVEDFDTLNGVLEKIKDLSDAQNPSAKTLACARLRLAKLTHEDPDVQEQMDRLIQELSS